MFAACSFWIKILLLLFMWSCWVGFVGSQLLGRISGVLLSSESVSSFVWTVGWICELAVGNWFVGRFCVDCDISLDDLSFLWSMSCNQQGCTLMYLLPFFTRTCCPSCPSTLAGPCYELLSNLLKYTESPVRYLMSPEVRMLCDKACFNFSEFLLVMNASLAFCIACRFL